MLIKCPECDLQVSDKAYTCPHCGYPLKYQSKRPYIPTRSHKRLPNGFGQISKITNKPLRNPYRAMVTVGKNPETGRPIVKPLKPKSYFPTYNDAYEALLKYNKDTNTSEITLQELYEEWSEWYFPVLSDSAISTHKVAWGHCEPIAHINVSELKTKNIRDCINNVSGVSVKPRIKITLSKMFDYAIDHEYCTQNIAKLVKLDPVVSKDLSVVKTPHIAFSEDEINIMWQNVYTIKFVDNMLIQCYMGLRPRELLGIKIENVDLENWTIICGMKTEAGKDRVVPIHSSIRELVRMKYKVASVLGSQWLFNNIQTHGMSYDSYKIYFKKAIKEMELNKDHRPHDPRKTFVTLAKKYKVDEYAIKRIVGHAIDDITEDVYTERSIDWLKEEIEKIKI